MYLTTHRVRSLRGLVGINGALYLHGSEQPPTATPEELEHIVNTEPGTLARTRTDVAPGGNAVEAFLDIVGPDEADQNSLEAFLRGAAVQMSGLSLSYSARSLVLRFSCSIGLEPDARALFNELAQAAIALRTSPAPQTSATLNVKVTQENGDWRFDLEDGSYRLLLQTFPGLMVARSIRVPLDAIDHMQREHGRLYPDVVEWLTTKPLEDMRMFAIQFQSSDGVVWKWPV